MQSSLVLQVIDGLTCGRSGATTATSCPRPAFYLEDDPEVIAARLAQRPSLTRLELTGTPGKELAALPRRRTRSYAGEDWPQHIIDCRGKDPGQVVADILDQLDP